MADTSLTNSPSLEEVKIAFDDFRRQQGKTSRIPDHLWVLLRLLRNQYKRHEICQVCSISHYQFNKYILQKSTVFNPTLKCSLSPFIEIPFSPVEKEVSPCPESSEKSHTLTIFRQNGTELILTTHGTISDFSPVIELFLKR